MPKYIDEKTRVVVKFYLPAIGFAICLQRKRWYGWKTVSWNYPSVMMGKDQSYILQWLLWHEARSIRMKRRSLVREAKQKIYNQF